MSHGDDEDFLPAEDGAADAPPPPELGAEAATGDGASVQKEKRRRTAALRAKDEDDKFWRDALSTLVGRRCLWRHLVEANLGKTTFVCGPNGFPDSNGTWFEAGKRAVADRLFADLQILDHMGVYLMLCENDPAYAKAPRPTVRLEG